MSVHGKAFRPPADQRRLFDRATRLEWITLGFMLTIIAAIGCAMGGSEAMKAVWIENVITGEPSSCRGTRRI